MNVLDWIILIILGVSTGFSAWKGFVRDLFSLIGLAGGALGATHFYPAGQSILETWLTASWFAAALSWIIIFLIVYVAAIALGRLVRASLAGLQLGWLDRTTGLLFGAVKGGLLSIGLVMVLTIFFAPEAAIIKGSRLAPRLIEVAGDLAGMVPGALGQRILEALPPPKEEGADHDKRSNKET
jgi:membrane protein required for colicin V production